MNFFAKKNRLFLAVASAAFLATAQSVSAAVLYISAPDSVAVGEKLQIRVMLDPEGADINAVEGVTQIFGLEDSIVFDGLRDGRSFVDLWIVRPQLADAEIKFAGIIKAGFSGPSGEIFSADFIAKEEGVAAFDFSGMRALANDGAASPVGLNQEPAKTTIVISENPVLGKDGPDIDNNPPFEFEASVTKSDSIMGGKYFVALNARDDDSGIAGFQIMEIKPFGAWPLAAKKPEWRDCQSPCALEDQSLGSAIYAKASDRAGNHKIIFIAPSKKLAWFDNIFIVSILGLFFAGALLLVFRILKKR